MPALADANPSGAVIGVIRRARIRTPADHIVPSLVFSRVLVGQSATVRDHHGGGSVRLSAPTGRRRVRRQEVHLVQGKFTLRVESTQVAVGRQGQFGENPELFFRGGASIGTCSELAQQDLRRPRHAVAAQFPVGHGVSGDVQLLGQFSLCEPEAGPHVANLGRGDCHFGSHDLDSTQTRPKCKANRRLSYGLNANRAALTGDANRRFAKWAHPDVRRRLPRCQRGTLTTELWAPNPLRPIDLPSHPPSGDACTLSNYRHQPRAFA